METFKYSSFIEVHIKGLDSGTRPDYFYFPLFEGNNLRELIRKVRNYLETENPHFTGQWEIQCNVDELPFTAVKGYISKTDIFVSTFVGQTRKRISHIKRKINE